MGKIGNRTLPPLVYGKLTGVFEFAVDSVEITDKLFKNQDCSFVVQILWWGETKPLTVRPKRTQFVTEDKKQVVIDDQSGYFVKYEVRTKVKLFKSYLAKCDVMELVILDEVKNEVIGSSFLKDLIFLVYNTQLFTSTIINYSGNPIGKITCHFLFCEVSSTDSAVKKIPQRDKADIGLVPTDKWNDNELKININLSELHTAREEIMSRFESNRSSKKNSALHELSSTCDERRKLKLDTYMSQRSSNVHYNSPVTQKSLQTDGSGVGDMQDHLRSPTKPLSKSQTDAHSFEVELKIPENLDLPEHSKKIKECIGNNHTHGFTKTSDESKVPPQVKCVSNVKEKKIIVPSKKTHVMRKNVNPGENLNKTRDHKVAYPAKVTSKRVPTNKVKSSKNKSVSIDRTFKAGNRDKLGSAMSVKNIMKLPKPEKIPNSIIKSIVQSNGNPKTFGNVSSEISKLNKLYLNTKQGSHDCHPDLEKVPVKEHVKGIASDTAVDHSECEVEKKINSEVTTGNVLAPCEHSTSSKTDVHELRETYRKESPKNVEHSKIEKVNINNKLFFDLNDPIEKIYYETFFGKTETLGSNEFEIAELLNQPENKHILDVAPPGSTALPETAQRRSKDIVTSKTPTNEDIEVNSKFSPGRSDEVRRSYKPREALELESDCPSRVREEKATSEFKKAFDTFNTCDISSSEQEECDVRESAKGNRILDSHDEYTKDCHQCKYYKKLSELDRIIEALKEFETKLKKEAKQSTKTLKNGGHSMLPNVSDHRGGFMYRPGFAERFTYDSGNNLDPGEDNSDRGDLILANMESDCSKESDFIEFTNYISNR